MLKSYKAIFNKNEMLVESNALNKAKVIQDTKTTNKNLYIMHLVAKDVLDCLNNAKQLYFKHFECYPKSIEIEKTNLKTNNLQRQPEVINDKYLNLARAIQKVSA